MSIAAEYIAAVRALTAVHRERLLAAGVHPGDIDLGMVGVARGRLAKFDLFEPDPCGALTYLCPVRIDPFNPLCIASPVADSAVRFGHLIDIAAFHPDFPDRWALRLGTADCLGLIEPQYLGPEPVRVHRGPLGWLRAGCSGLVPLTRDRRDLYRLLSECQAIVAEDQAHARSLREVLSRPWPLPPISVDPQEVPHAA